MKTIWITGASGQLGQTFRFLSQNKHDFNFIFTDSKLLDLTDSKAVIDFLKKNQIDYCINTMAYTAVDKAESEPEKAYLLNAEVPIFLAESCKSFGIKFIHLSTDFVFDGQKNTAYTESDSPNPISIYGKSKLAGEMGILERNAESIIVRTAWVYSMFGNNFLKTMLRLAETKTELGVVADQIGTPTFAEDLAEGILKLVEMCENKPINGIFHCFLGYVHQSMSCIMISPMLFFVWQEKKFASNRSEPKPILLLPNVLFSAFWTKATGKKLQVWKFRIGLRVSKGFWEQFNICKTKRH